MVCLCIDVVVVVEILHESDFLIQLSILMRFAFSIVCCHKTLAKKKK